MSYERPAPESEDDLEVPGQPYLGLLGILSEYYRIREPQHKQGQTLTAALKYLYRIKQRTPNGFDEDQDFGLEMMNAVAEVTKKIDETKPEENTAKPMPELSKSPTPSSAFPTEEELEESDKEDFDLDDFGFSDSEQSSEDDFSSKIDSLVKMVKNTVKKRKRKKHRRSPDQNIKHSMANILGMEGMDDEPCIPKLKIRFGPRSPSASETSSGGEGNTSLNKDSPMKLKIKFGAATPPTKPSPLLTPPFPANIPPPPTLMPAPPLLHKPSTMTIPSSTPPSLQSYSPKYEAEEQSTAPLQPPKSSPLQTTTCSDNEEDKPPIKLTLRVHQPLRRARATISPRTEQLVNYIDDVTTFLNENDIPTEDLKPEDNILEILPGPPKLKMAPSITRDNCRKRKREISPKHEADKPTPKSVIAEHCKSDKIKTVPPLKFCMNKSKRVTNINHEEMPTKLKLKLPNKKSPPNSPIQIKQSCQNDKEQNIGTPKDSQFTPKNTSNVKADKPKDDWKCDKYNKAIAEKGYWLCGVFSNSLKLNQGQVDDEECDIRSNILPNYCGITYLRKKREFLLPYDIWWAKENDALAPRLPAPKPPITKLADLLKCVKSGKPTTPKCSEVVFDQHMGDSQSKRNKIKGRSSKQKNSTSRSTPKTKKLADKTSVQHTRKSSKEANQISKQANKISPVEIHEGFRKAALETLSSIVDAVDTTSSLNTTSLGSNKTHITIAEANFDESACSKEIATITSCTKDNSVTITIIPEISNQHSKETDLFITHPDAQAISLPMDAHNSESNELTDTDEMDVKISSPSHRSQTSPDSIRDDISESPDLIIESDCDSPIPLQEHTSTGVSLKFSLKETNNFQEENFTTSPEHVSDGINRRSLRSTSRNSLVGMDEVSGKNDCLVVDDSVQIDQLSQGNLQKYICHGADFLDDNENRGLGSPQKHISAQSVALGSGLILTHDDHQFFICPEQDDCFSTLQAKDSLSSGNPTDCVKSSQMSPTDVSNKDQIEECLSIAQQPAPIGRSVVECSKTSQYESPVELEGSPIISSQVSVSSPGNTNPTSGQVVESSVIVDQDSSEKHSVIVDQQDSSEKHSVIVDQSSSEKPSVDSPEHSRQLLSSSEPELVMNITLSSVDLVAEYESNLSEGEHETPRCLEFNKTSGRNIQGLEKDGSNPVIVSPLTPRQSPPGDASLERTVNRVDPHFTLDHIDNIEQGKDNQITSDLILFQDDDLQNNQSSSSFEGSEISFSPSRTLNDVVLNDKLLGNESDISTPPAKRIKL